MFALGFTIALLAAACASKASGPPQPDPSNPNGCPKTPPGESEQETCATGLICSYIYPDSTLPCNCHGSDGGVDGHWLCAYNE
jgi:hypothetical protein